MLLAILRPDLKITLCDSVGKKAVALQEFAGALDLSVEIYHARAESLLEDFRYDVCIARAVGPLVKLCRWFEGSWASIGRLLAIKGPKWRDEMESAEQAGVLKGLTVEPVDEYPTPGTDWKSVILKITS